MNCWWRLSLSNKHYGAFLLDHSIGPRWVDLGPAQPLDQAVRDLIAGANDWSVSLARREKQAAASAEGTAQEALRRGYPSNLLLCEFRWRPSQP